MKSPIFGADSENLNTGATRYHTFCGTWTSAWDATETNTRQNVPTDMWLSGLFVLLSGAPGAGGSGKSYAFTVMINGVASALTCTISETATSATDSTHRVWVNAGDTISLRSVPTGTPAGPSGWWNLISEGAGQAILGGGTGSVPSSSATNYGIIQGAASSLFSATEANVTIIAPCAGTLSNLYALLSVAPSSGKSWAITLMVDGVPAALTCSIADTATTGSDLTHSVAITAGQTISLRFVPSGTPTSPNNLSWGILFKPTVDGDSFFGYGSSNNPSTSATNFEVPLANGANFWSTGEQDVVVGAWTMTAMYVKRSAAPGIAASGKSHTLNLRSGASDAGPSVTILETATTGSDAAHPITAVQGDKQSLRSTVASTPAAGSVHIGVLIHTAPLSLAVPSRRSMAAMIRR